MNDITPTLTQLGWKPFFQQQLSIEEFTQLSIGRIIEQHRNSLKVISTQGQFSLIIPPNSDRICVGDWVMFDHLHRLIRRLDRFSLFERKSPGTQISTQLIAANIDLLMIVCSLNQDFNLNRIERYLAIANDAQVEPIIVLTKADQCHDVAAKQQQVQTLDPFIIIHTLNALDQDDLKQLQSYCGLGKTLAFLGSSGVGKSTIINGLLGYKALDTGMIRENDSKGRHTTTYRALKILPQGGILMDTPGMRELQLAGSKKGVSETFNEIIELANQCRFSNCEHHAEPGCAVQDSIKKGEITQRRFDSYQKLIKEQVFNQATLAERKTKNKAFTKLINRVQNKTRQQKKG